MKLDAFVVSPTTYDNLPDTIEVSALIASQMLQAYRTAVERTREQGALFAWKSGEGLSLKAWQEGDEFSVMPTLDKLPMWEGRAVGSFHTHFTERRSGHAFSGGDLAGMNVGDGWADAVQSDNGLCYLMVQPLGALEIPSTLSRDYARELETTVETFGRERPLDQFNPTQLVGLAIYSKALQVAHVFRRGLYVGTNEGRELVLTRKSATEKLLGVL